MLYYLPSDFNPASPNILVISYCPGPGLKLLVGFEILAVTIAFGILLVSAKLSYVPGPGVS